MPLLSSLLFLICFVTYFTFYNLIGCYCYDREQEEVERENDRKLKEAMERVQAEKRVEAEEHKRRLGRLQLDLEEVVPCVVLSCLVLCCLVLSCLLLSANYDSLGLSCLLLPCLLLFVFQMQFILQNVHQRPFITPWVSRSRERRPR
jgi:hypothetical protein